MNVITLRDIRKGHPFGVSSPTDADYVRIAKAVFDRLRYTPFGAERSVEELKMPKGSKALLPEKTKNIILYIPSIEEGKLCTIMDCAEYVKHKNNPMYNREKAKSHFLISDIEQVPGEFIRYAIANNLMPDFALNSNRGYAHGRQLAQDNLDFLARTLRRQDY